MVRKLQEFRAQFKYRYTGGGYFRDMTVPRGTNADIKHGDEIITKFCEEFAEYLAKGVSGE